MIPTSLAAVPFTPSYLSALAAAPVFHLRPASIVQRGSFEAMLAAPPFNAGRVYPWDLASAAEDAARALLEGDDLGAVLAALSALRQVLDADKLEAEQRQLLAAIHPILAEHWPDYAALRRQEAQREELLPIMAAKHFLTGWDYDGKAFATGRDGLVTDDALRQLNVFEVRTVGLEAYRLMYAEEQRPLSLPPSKSGPVPAPSPAGARPRSAAPGGKSKARASGLKTRA